MAPTTPKKQTISKKPEKKDTRAQRREKIKINNYLRALIHQFFLYRDKLEDPDGSDASMKLSEINLEWRKYCHRKWKLGISPETNAFEKVVIDLIDRQEKREVVEKNKEEVLDKLNKDVTKLNKKPIVL